MESAVLTILLDTPDGDDPPSSVRDARESVLKKIAQRTADGRAIEVTL